ncbi:hypothetical protein U9M48_041917 [Paspalum notatum var. saurae]|uniref:Uncharacterized protein n=1 Tax=Paspalum notatum var. saurae TaxID=547442 RepID=A0AAQ3UU92_PASNO
MGCQRAFRTLPPPTPLPRKAMEAVASPRTPRARCIQARMGRELGSGAVVEIAGPADPAGGAEQRAWLHHRRRRRGNE